MESPQVPVVELYINATQLFRWYWNSAEYLLSGYLVYKTLLMYLTFTSKQLIA